MQSYCQMWLNLCDLSKVDMASNHFQMSQLHWAVYLALKSQTLCICSPSPILAIGARLFICNINQKMGSKWPGHFVYAAAMSNSQLREIY